MNIEMRTSSSSRCSQTQTTSVPSTINQSMKSFSVVLSYTELSTYYDPVEGKTLTSEQAMAAQTADLDAIFKNLPDVRQYLHPWYFPDSQQSNITYIRTVAIQIVSKQSDNTPENANSIFQALLQKYNLQDFPQSFGIPTNVNSYSNSISVTDPLTDEDKKTLKAMHCYTKKKMDTSYVDTVATQLAIKKMHAKNTNAPLPTLNKQFIDTHIAGLNIWQSTIHGKQVINHLRTFFS